MTQALEPQVEANAIAIIFDIDAYRAGEFALFGPQIEAILEQLRHYKNQIFFSSLTEQLVSRYE